MYGLRTSAEESSMGDPEEDIMAPKLGICLTEIDRNKNTMRTRYKNLGEPGGSYITKFQCIRKVLVRKRGGDGARGAHTPSRRGQLGPAPGVGVATPAFVSSSVPYRNLPYVIETSKI